MRHERLTFRAELRVIAGNRPAQCPEMTMPPGGGEGGADNRHRGADQWLYVVAGRGEALVARTLNFYAPPAYRRDGEPLPRGRK